MLNQFSIKSKQIALVDFDGVILKNTKPNKIILKRIENYVSQQLGIKNDKLIKSINKQLYQACNHTIYGLKVLDCIDTDLSTFNKNIYSNLDVEWKLDDNEIRNWENFYNFMYIKNIPIYIFSNAPKTWCNHFIKDYNVQYINDHISSYPPVIFPKDELLKNDINLYQAITNKFNKHNIIFFDDNFANLKPVLKHPKWTSVLINDDADFTFKLNNGMYIMKELSNIDHLFNNDYLAIDNVK